MERSFKQKIILIGIPILIVISIIGIAYSVFTGQLNITGSAVNRSSSWDIHFENLSNITTTHTAKVLSQPSLDGTTTIEDYSVSTTTPGDSISFTFDVRNSGNYNAKITSVTIGTPTCTGTDTTSNTNVCSHLHYTLTYDSGATVAVNDIIQAKDYKTMKVTLTYDDTVTASELATADVSISNLGIVINFEQSGDALVKDNGEVANYRVYHQGEKVTINNEDYYVIADSGADKDYVVALKAEPLTVAEVNTYGASISITAQNQNGYGGMGYGYTENYSESNAKVVIDAWVMDNFQNNELKEVNGYNARLITNEEYTSILTTYVWRKVTGADYWTMAPNPQNPTGRHYFVRCSDGSLDDRNAGSTSTVIRPVINVYKSSLETNNNE